MKTLGKRTGTTNASISNRIQGMEERTSGVEYDRYSLLKVDSLVNEVDSLVKENTKSKKSLAQNIQKIWDTMKRQNLRIGIEWE